MNPVAPGPCLMNRWRCNTHRPFAREALPPRHRYYGLMCQSCCLPSTMHGDSSMDLCSLDHPLLVNRTFPTLSLRIFLRMHGPLPRQSPRCICPFLPAEHRPSPRYDRSATQRNPKQRLQLRTPFRGCSHSFMFKPPDLLATQVAPTDTLKLYGSRDVYFRAP